MKRFLVLTMLFVFAFVSVFAVGGSKVEAADKSLVAHYTFDGDAEDSSDYSNNGRIIGNVTFVDGKIGKGAKFDGSSYIEVADDNTLDLKKAFTFSVWLYREKSLDEGIRMPVLCKGESDDFFESAYRLYLGLGSTNAEISLIDENQSDSAEHSSSATVPTQNWTHLAVTWDGTRATFFKNGAVSTVIRTEIGNILSNDHNLLIGADSVDGNFYHGIMDDLRIYNKALSDVEIKALTEVNPPAPPTTTPPTTTPPTTTPPPTTTQPQTPAASIVVPQGLMAYYAFEDNFNDTSGNNNNGSPIGNVTFVNGKVGKGAKFDGAGYINVNDSNSLDIPNAITITAWLYKEKPLGEGIRTPILCKGETDDFFDTPYRFYLGLGANNPEICLIDENQSDSLEDVSNAIVGTQNWTHVAVTWDGNYTRFYKNGILSDDPIETEYLTTMLCNDQNLLIGMDSCDGIFYNGIIDELRIYNRALSDAEVKTVYEVKPTTPVVPGDLSALKPTTPGLPEAPTTTIILQIDNPKMYVNGVERDIDPGYGTKPIILNGRTILPIRSIIETLGGTVGWDQAEQRVTLNVNNTNINMWIGREQYNVNGVQQNLDVAPIVINARTLLPLRALLESIGYVVEWNNENQAVIIVSNN